MGGLIKMRRVKQLGFLVVNKPKPKPKREIQQINLNNFLKRLNEHRFINTVDTTSLEDILIALPNITGVYGETTYQTVGSLLRMEIKRINRALLSIQWNTKDIGFGSYNRSKNSWIFLFDYQRNKTYVFVNKKTFFETELSIWESSDVNYWG
jgi:hypothetical protein